MANQTPFVFLSENHFHGDSSDIAYFPEVQRFSESLSGIFRAWLGIENPEEVMSQRGHGPVLTWKEMADAMVAAMDEADIDVASILRSAYNKDTGYTRPYSTNGQMMEICSYYPDRLLLESNVGPIIRRGVEHANWELEYLVKNHGAVMNKIYPVEDDGPLNDRRMWPFYAKAEELGVPLTIHLGIAYPRNHLTINAFPHQLDEVCIDFPDLKIIGYHMAWPYHKELIALAGKHKNLYLSLTGHIAWYERAPWTGYEIIGESLMWCGPDKIVIGNDGGPADIGRRVDYIRNLEMPVELQQRYAYPKVTQETRDKILGLNLARITGVEPRKRAKPPVK